MSKRSGGSLRGPESTRSWSIREAATLWVAIVPGALHQPEEHENMATSSQVPSKSYTNLFCGQPQPRTIDGSKFWEIDFQIVKLRQY